MSDRCEDLACRSLDGLLSHFGHEERDNGKIHDPIKDCHCAAKVYMKLMELPPKKKIEAGFVKK